MTAKANRFGAVAVVYAPVDVLSQVASLRSAAVPVQHNLYDAERLMLTQELRERAWVFGL
jgi:hypothetical protein